LHKIPPQELIRKKREGGTLSSDELAQFFGGYLAGDTPDYQVSAMLMAMFLRGLSQEETVSLTKLNRDSGIVLKWPYPQHLVVDKHSTGGIGDKTSLVLMPLCILEGLKVPMISGRGLGHTGGTLDKLESIPGMNPKPDMDAARKLMARNGGIFMGQTEEIARLDRRLYALRDVTATVECRPLIVASILSKKLAEGLGSLVLDVKFGSGAFIVDQTESRKLAQQLVEVAKGCGLPTRALHTNMGSPLGDHAGNALEIIETAEILKGNGPHDTRDLSIELAAHMVQMAFPSRKLDEIRGSLLTHLRSGKAFELFCKIIASQGGDVSSLDDYRKLPTAKHQLEVRAPVSGFIECMDVRRLGVAIVELGGGRRRAEDKIDFAVGLSQIRKVGDKVEVGETLAIVHCNSLLNSDHIVSLVQGAFQIGPSKPEFKLIAEVIS
jgi:pyrimidine-nucleoside phosphorylase